LLDADKLPSKRLELEGDRLLIRFSDPEVQLKAADILKDRLGRDYIVALNLASSTPSFLRALGLNPMYLGLDLRGGVHFLMQVDMDATIKQIEESYVDEIRAQLRNEKVLYSSVGRAATGGLQVEFKDAAERDKAAQLLRKSLGNLQQSEVEPLGLKLTLGEREIKEKRDFALQQNITSPCNRTLPPCATGSTSSASPNRSSSNRAAIASWCNCPACRIRRAPRKSSAPLPPWNSGWQTKKTTGVRQRPPVALR